MCLIFKRRHLETGLDGLDTARGVAGHALQEEQPRLLVQDRVRGSASDHLHEMIVVKLIDVKLIDVKLMLN